jgi:hypothetical protein
MAIARVTASSLTQGLPKRRTMLAGNSVILPGSYDAIGTANGTGSSNTITFTSIPSTYKHLQLRGIVKSTTAGSSFSSTLLNFNSDSSSSYTRHIVWGDGASTYAYGLANTTAWAIGGNDLPSAGYTNIFGAHVVDILDYANTSKNKTVRALTGCDVNGAGEILLSSTVYLKTNAITSIQLVSASGNFNQYTQYSLYGIK